MTGGGRPGGDPLESATAAARSDLNPGAQLRLLMRAWRDRLDLLRTPGGSEDSTRLRVTQDDLARLLGVSPTWYRNLERGVLTYYSDRFLNSVADVLQLDPDERHVLFRLAVGHQPPHEPERPSTVITDTLDEIVQTQPWPTYIVDAAWDVHVYNRAMDQWFPHLRQVGNIMRLAFCVPDTGRQLVDFEHDWAPSLVGQMRGALARWPDNTRLTQLIADVLAANEQARRLWDQPVVRIHADGERRRLYLPDTGQTRHIEIVALNLLRADHLRMIMLKPISDRPAAEPDAAVVSETRAPHAQAHSRGG